VISGLLAWNSGNVFLGDRDLSYNQNYFQEHLGLCPQHDILYSNLTPYQHIQLIGLLKGMRPSELDKLADQLLASFKLLKVKNKAAGKFSGGMKRRLSLLLATLGDPKIMIMDEPTTGMDPVNRRNVWNFIDKFKDERIVILTTHSMEEAESLGDRISIMKEGLLCAVGDSAHLKNKLAGGYRLHIKCNGEGNGIEIKVIQSIQTIIPTAAVESVSPANVRMLIPASHVPEMFDLTAQFGSNAVEDEKEKEKENENENEKGKEREREKEKENDHSQWGMIADWSVTQMTMEDVFHHLSQDHYAASAQKDIETMQSYNNHPETVFVLETPEGKPALADSGENAKNENVNSVSMTEIKSEDQ
jgi:ABC-type multidrug transport system ATPase subunit